MALAVPVMNGPNQGEKCEFPAVIQKKTRLRLVFSFFFGLKNSATSELATVLG